MCDLKHISPLPQDDSLVNRWGLWSTPQWCSRVQKWSKVVAGDRDMARPGFRLNVSTRRPCPSWTRAEIKLGRKLSRLRSRRWTRVSSGVKVRITHHL